MFKTVRQQMAFRAALGLALAGAGGATQAGPTFEYGDEGFVTLGYSVQMWAQARDFTSNNDSGSSTDFFLRRNRITLSGQYNDYIGFYAQLEAGSDSRAGQDNRSVYYRDAYLTLDWTDSMRFIIGRFKNTFTRENLEACLEPLTLDRGEVLAYTPFGGTRDTGAAMWGNLADGQFQYRLMLSDGRESDEVAKDSPRMTARAHWSFWDPEFDYGYRGTYLGTRKVLTVGAAYDTQRDVTYADWGNRQDIRDYEAWTADVFMEYPTASGTVTASAAYMDYSTDDAINGPDPSTLPVTSELKGHYAKLGYLLPGKVGMGRLQFFLRHEDLDYGVSNGYYDNRWLSVGANYYIHGQQLKVTFEYATVDYDRQHPTIQSLRDYDQATLGLQLIF
ncbi:MAG: selenite/tellurite reduction operon porin ExtI [Gammaproteobacteria bacterium]|nr:selenite/tellurite reduction operon porin ExtI [Gammaproteobacteria bacterium]